MTPTICVTAKAVPHGECGQDITLVHRAFTGRTWTEASDNCWAYREKQMRADVDAAVDRLGIVLTNSFDRDSHYFLSVDMYRPGQREVSLNEPL